MPMPDDVADGPNERWGDPAFEHAVRQTAYFLWEQDGRPDGREQEYWYRSLERTLRERTANAELQQPPKDISALVGEKREVDDNQDDLGRSLT
jgi:hypothetical protein